MNFIYTHHIKTQAIVICYSTSSEAPNETLGRDPAKYNAHDAHGEQAWATTNLLDI
jgi:hypothetical protein